MNFIKYCEMPENEQWITQFMWNMKLDTGFDEQALIESVEEQAESEGVELTDAENDDVFEFFSEWYDELDYPASGAI